jgi:alkanesulfonate monooxygenase SsuD/methylene tetrahydromethanopterin reductase-like flavin-dependent oxidoreductase (luciferase family)
MKLGILLRTTGAVPIPDMDLVLEAERLGFDSAWAGEAYGGDAVTPIAWMLARTTKIKGGTGIMQMPARTPACAAMTAISLQALSGGRFLCGIGPSGPQVVEGWHGQPYGKPLTRTKEYVSIIRQILARRGPLEHQGDHYHIPYTGPDATGLGKPLKSIVHPNPDLKIYTASIGTAGLRVAGEVADGVLPFLLCKRGSGRQAPQNLWPISTSRPMFASAWATMSKRAATRSAPSSRSTSAAWARGARTSTTTSPSAWVTKLQRSKFRIYFSPASATKPPRKCLQS